MGADEVLSFFGGEFTEFTDAVRHDRYIEDCCGHGQSPATAASFRRSPCGWLRVG